LEALSVQTCRAAKVIVVVRAGDAESEKTADLFASVIPLEVVSIDRPGQVQALNRGLSVVRTAIVAITDDDARPHPDWLEQILVRFRDPHVGAVGGRDVVYWEGELVGGDAELVGRVRWYGRVVGNHHLQSNAQEVEFLKGANMSYRRALLPGFDECLAGDGSQICNDMQASLRVHRSGWRVVWDPAVTVDHYPAERLDDDKRIAPTLSAVTNVVHNQTYILLSLLAGWRRIAAFVYPLIVGTRETPGLFLLLGATMTGTPIDRGMFGFRANWQGRARGLATFVRTRGRPQFPVELDGTVRDVETLPCGRAANRRRLSALCLRSVQQWTRSRAVSRGADSRP
jgi:cellulose synthase/poly-beta-1,6-N-acetylglucosamine synthase-like glycosyltransferase